MSYSAVGLEATSVISNGQGLGVNPNLSSTLTAYNAIPTVSLATAIFNTASTVADSGQLTTALKALGNTNPVLYGIAPGTGVPSFTSNITAQANAPFANGVAGFANVMMQVIPFISQSFEVAGSTQLVKNKTYQASGPNFNNRSDLVTNGLGSIAPLLSQSIAGFGTMYDITKLGMLGDPYVFTNNLLSQGFGNIGGLLSNLASVGITASNILNVPNTVTGSSPDVLTNVLSQVTGQDLLDIVSATGFSYPSGSNINSLDDILSLQNVVSGITYKSLVAQNIRSLSDLGNYLNDRLGSGSFTSFSDLATTLTQLIIPTFSNITSNLVPTSTIISNATATSLSSVTGSGTGAFGNPTIIDLLGSCAGIPYVNNFANITSTLNTINLSTVTANLTQLYTTVNTYVSGGTFNSTTLAPVVSAVSAMNNYVATLTQVTPAEQLYGNCYSHYTSEVSLLSLAGITVTNPGITPNRLADLARTITSIGSDPTQLGYIQFFTSLAPNTLAGDSVRSVIAENFNSQLLQNKGITFNNAVQPAQKLAQAQKFGISISTLQQMVQ